MSIGELRIDDRLADREGRCVLLLEKPQITCIETPALRRKQTRRS